MRGHSLVEMLAVLTVMSILAAIAYPSYASYVTRTRRVEGQAALTETLLRQERYFAIHQTYVAFSADAPPPDGMRWWSGSTARLSSYELRAQRCDGQPLNQCVELRAMPGTVNVNPKFRDPECGMLRVDSSGLHGADGPIERCWP